MCTPIGPPKHTTCILYHATATSHNTPHTFLPTAQPPPPGRSVCIACSRGPYQLTRPSLSAALCGIVFFMHASIFFPASTSVFVVLCQFCLLLWTVSVLHISIPCCTLSFFYMFLFFL